jgi:hypothetical protein
MKIIFLDVDGVLVTPRSHRASPGQEKNQGGLMGYFDPIAIGLLRRLCEITGAKVVLTSAWRYNYGPMEIQTLFLNLGFPKHHWHPMTFVPDIRGGAIRGEEVAAWLQENPGVVRYVLIDDSHDYLLDQLVNWVCPDNNEGFLLRDYEKALQILLTPEPPVA